MNDANSGQTGAKSTGADVVEVELEVVETVDVVGLGLGVTTGVGVTTGEGVTTGVGATTGVGVAGLGAGVGVTVELED